MGSLDNGTHYGTVGLWDKLRDCLYNGICSGPAANGTNYGFMGQWDKPQDYGTMGQWNYRINYGTAHITGSEVVPLPKKKKNIIMHY